MFENDGYRSYPLDGSILIRMYILKSCHSLFVHNEKETMTLWVQPIFGDLIEVPFSPPTPLMSWRPIYQFLHAKQCPDRKLHELRLFHNGSPDLSTVSDGELLHLVVTEPIAERWKAEHSVTQKEHDSILFHHSTLSWYDARWGDPYNDPKVQYRTSLTIYIVVREIKDISMDFTINPEYFHELYGNKEKKRDMVWYSSLREACYAFRKELHDSHSEEVMTERTCEHLIQLWNVYHGSNQHLIDNGRYYDY